MSKSDQDVALLHAAPAPAEAKPFWKRKTLDQMTPVEWESLCDGCGRCCLNKLEEEETGRIFLTNVACRLLDLGSCRCTDYEHRHAQIPDCLKIDLAAVRSLAWLPATCGYRIVAEGRDLGWWHPLISGTPDTVHDAGISVRGFAQSESDIPLERLEDYIVDGFPRPRKRQRLARRPL